MKDRARLIVRIVALAVVVTLVARQFLRPHELAPISQRSAPATAGVQPGQKEMRLGTLTLKACEIGHKGEADLGPNATAAAFCTQFDVPENWDDPQGRHIQLQIAIVKSRAAHPPADLVTYLDGGPGGAATETYPLLASALAPLREKRNILLVDQRGTGHSNPLKCERQKNEDPSAVKNIASARQLVQQCLDYVRTYAAPEYYTTTDATRDLEAVRQALGGARLNVIGLSYGTRMAQQYAGHYPASIRTVVLDSVVPNSLALGSDHASNLESAMRLEFALCTQDAHCNQVFGDTYQTLYRVRDHLRSHPEEVAARDPNTFEPQRLTMTEADLAGVVRMYLYTPLTASLLPLMLHEADHGNLQPLLSQKKLIADTLGAQISGGMELSVMCSEDADLLSPRPEDANTLMGNTIVERLKQACEVWPHGSRPADFHQPWTSDVPTLVLEGQYDPVTPPAYGEQVAKTLRHGRFLYVPGEGHGVIGAGCMPKLVSQLVDNMQPEKIDATCLKQLGNTPPFVDFNGPSP